MDIVVYFQKFLQDNRWELNPKEDNKALLVLLALLWFDLYEKFISHFMAIVILLISSFHLNLILRKIMLILDLKIPNFLSFFSIYISFIFSYFYLFILWAYYPITSTVRLTEYSKNRIKSSRYYFYRSYFRFKLSKFWLFCCY